MGPRASSTKPMLNLKRSCWCGWQFFRMGFPIKRAKTDDFDSLLQQKRFEISTQRIASDQPNVDKNPENKTEKCQVTSYFNRGTGTGTTLVPVSVPVPDASLI
uniref:Uncharacterized protein n=1 Tax=Romanomermis culicivorax TaxID=13658 RepID=A0A915I1A8_ROMCU